MACYRRVYEMLKSRGHSPVKALEILLEARRGDELALAWIRFLRRMK